MRSPLTTSSSRPRSRHFLHHPLHSAVSNATCATVAVPALPRHALGGALLASLRLSAPCPWFCHFVHYCSRGARRPRVNNYTPRASLSRLLITALCSPFAVAASLAAACASARDNLFDHGNDRPRRCWFPSRHKNNCWASMSTCAVPIPQQPCADHDVGIPVCFAAI